MSKMICSYRRSDRVETLLASITRRQLLSSLKLCLDVGDAVSYAGGSGQTWSDRSGLGNDFFRGTTSAAQATDPTFNGAAGVLSKNTYWGLDGGDLFTINTGAAGYSTALAGWISNIHKNLAKFTLFCWYYPATTALFCLLGTSGRQIDSDRGFQWGNANGVSLEFGIRHGMVAAYSNLPIQAGKWNCAAVSIDEAVGVSNALFFQDGVFTVTNCNYASPDTGTATNILQIGGTGGNQTSDVRYLPNGSRLSQVAVWEGRALSQDQITGLYKATRPRFK